MIASNFVAIYQFADIWTILDNFFSNFLSIQNTANQRNEQESKI